MRCPLCGYDYDENALTCSTRCPMAAVQGCNLLCCPNCGYQMVDERKSGIARLLRKLFRPKAGAAPPVGGAGSGASGPLRIAPYRKGQP